MTVALLIEIAPIPTTRATSTMQPTTEEMPRSVATTTATTTSHPNRSPPATTLPPPSTTRPTTLPNIVGTTCANTSMHNVIANHADGGITGNRKTLTTPTGNDNKTMLVWPVGVADVARDVGADVWGSIDVAIVAAGGHVGGAAAVDAARCWFSAC